MLLLEAYEQLEKDQEKELAAGERYSFEDLRLSVSLGRVESETKTTMGRERGAADGGVQATREGLRRSSL